MEEMRKAAVKRKGEKNERRKEMKKETEPCSLQQCAGGGRLLQDSGENRSYPNPRLP